MEKEMTPAPKTIDQIIGYLTGMRVIFYALRKDKELTGIIRVEGVLKGLDDTIKFLEQNREKLK